MPYPELMVRPMRDELTSIGVTELRNGEEVERFMDDAKSGSSLLVINSVCGCAAGQARPGVRVALGSPVTPDRSATVFAGQDVEATQKARSFFADVPPSSPSIALFKDGQLVHFVPRHRIEGQPAEAVADGLITAFEEHCG